ncbi:MAG: putative porin [Cyclobacteriaceae bacterium]|nr:hypothetical protein [Cyclobacteriaceae bacterium]MCH8517068.1 putative porin [Cyclobacteriaceae bacterium]
MKKVIPLFLVGMLTLLGHYSFGQFVDDSTEMVYGPETTEYFYEKYIRQNQEKRHIVDSIILGQHRWDYISELDYEYQNLGNMGTPMFSIFYKTPNAVGRRSGFNHYDFLFHDANQVKYYDTKSPYSRFRLTIGGENRSRTEAEYAVNVTPLWGFSGFYRRTQSDRQMGARNTRGDRSLTSNMYTFNTNYRSNDDKYRLLAHFTRLGVVHNESGGVILPPNTEGDYNDFFGYQDALIMFRDGVSGEISTNYHVYHEYSLDELLQVYHTVDRRKQFNYFRKPITNADNAVFIPTFGINLSPEQTSDRTNFTEFTNEVGLKGYFDKAFYIAYLKRRDVAMRYAHLPTQGFFGENYLGFDLGYVLNEGNTLNVKGEYLIGEAAYTIGGDLQSTWFSASYERNQYMPSFMHTLFVGNHGEWFNSSATTSELVASDAFRWANPEADILKGRANLNTGAFTFQPHVSITNLNNHLYFDQNFRPAQADYNLQIFTPGLDLSIQLSDNWKFANRFKYTQVTGDRDQVIQIPEFFGNANITYTNTFFEKLFIETGIDLHYRSDHQQYGWNPGIQQFHLQDEVVTPAFFVADFFLNFRISRMNVYTRLNHLNQGFPNDGYFITPFYSGIQRTFDFGLNWAFYD